MPFVKGQVANPKGRGHSKNYATLDKEKRRAEFDKLAADKFIEWINSCKAEYGLDQFLGKAEEKIAMKVEDAASPEIKELAKKLNELYKKDSLPN